jgi:hypothetical protein
VWSLCTLRSLSGWRHVMSRSTTTAFSCWGPRPKSLGGAPVWLLYTVHCTERGMCIIDNALSSVLRLGCSTLLNLLRGQTATKEGSAGFAFGHEHASLIATKRKVVALLHCLFGLRASTRSVRHVLWWHLEQADSLMISPYTPRCTALQRFIVGMAAPSR